MRGFVTAAIVAAAAAVAHGCVIEANDLRAPRYGTATVAWTLGGRADPARCASFGAAQAHVVLQLRAPVADEYVQCTAFGRRWPVEHGWYTATVTLVDGSGVPVSSTHETAPFYVSPDQDTVVTLDFVAASFQ